MKRNFLDAVTGFPAGFTDNAKKMHDAHGPAWASGGNGGAAETSVGAGGGNTETAAVQ